MGEGERGGFVWSGQACEVYGTLLVDSVASVTSARVVAYILVLYLAGRAFTDCTRIAMGFWIVPGLRIVLCLQPCRSVRGTR